MSEPSDRLRLFIAIHVPKDVREKLCAIQKHFEKSMPKDAVRWTPFEQLRLGRSAPLSPGTSHLTLEFLGGVPATEVPRLQQALTKVAAGHGPFRLRAESIGAFSSVRNPRVIWVGLNGDLDGLKALQTDVHASAIPFERDPEDRVYRPHLTLGRVRPVKPRELRQVSQALAAITAAPFGEWKVTEFALMQSKLSPHGAQHSVLATLPLQAIER